MKALIFVVVRWYRRHLSPILKARGVECRYEPTCSEYLLLAVERYGVWRGVLKGVKRFLDCSPYGKRPYRDYP